MNETLRVSLNGEEREFEPGATVAEAVELAGAGADDRGVAVAVDGQVVARGQWSRSLHDGDSVEVVRAIQGGCR